MRKFTNLALILVTGMGISAVRGSEPIKIVDGDRIVYLGNTFAERDATYGYLETWLTTDHCNKTFTFRNLGWSGDTVWGDARAGFGGRADGFKHLKEHVFALRPTIILVAYGMNESFAGEPGLAAFDTGLNTLLDTLGETKAKIVLISPIPLEDLGPPLPSPKIQNVNVELYVETMKKKAEARHLGFINLYETWKDIFRRQSAKPDSRYFTDDGQHLNQKGYQLVAASISADLAGPGDDAGIGDWQVQLKGSEIVKSRGVAVSDVRLENRTLRFRATSGFWTREDGDVVSDFLKPGEPYSLRIDGKAFGPVKVEDAMPESGRCVWHADFGDLKKQYEQLRAAINKKNNLYFYRWRPQNETYLFGFRKHEQGNNGREIPLFDPLVAEMEAEIARLKKPKSHLFELTHDKAP